MTFNELTSIQRDKLLAAKNPVELEAIASEEGIELSDEILDAIAGGWDPHWQTCSPYPQGGKPSVIA